MTGHKLGLGGGGIPLSQFVQLLQGFYLFRSILTRPGTPTGKITATPPTHRGNTTFDGVAADTQQHDAADPVGEMRLRGRKEPLVSAPPASVVFLQRRFVHR